MKDVRVDRLGWHDIADQEREQGHRIVMQRISKDDPHGLDAEAAFACGLHLSWARLR